MPTAATSHVAFRANQEDEGNLADLHAALRAPGRPVATVSACLRDALRVSAFLSRNGQLRATLAAYRADLAGEPMRPAARRA